MPAPINEGKENGESNGRVTLAILGIKIDAMAKTVEEMVRLYHADHDKLTTVCTKFEDIDTLKRAIIGNIAAVIVVAMAAIYAIFGT